MSLHCCAWLAALLSRGGEKGFSVIAFRDGEHRSFYLQARPFEPDVVREHSTVDEATGRSKWPPLVDSHGTPVPFVSSMDLLIERCPSCGKDLAALIGQHQAEFDALATCMSHLAS